MLLTLKRLFLTLTVILKWAMEEDYKQNSAISSNIPASLSYIDYISQLIRYYRAFVHNTLVFWTELGAYAQLI